MGMEDTSSRKEDKDSEKGRGSYRCGKCGVPKKGHICPYQPKFKRRPDEPPPETRNASTQVEMDEFLVLRRLNLEIQGFPESYTSDPANKVGAEPHRHPPRSHAVPSPNGPPSMQSPPMSVGGRVISNMPPSHGMPPVRSHVVHGGTGSPGQTQGMPPHSMGMAGRPSPPLRHSGEARRGDINSLGRMGGAVALPTDVGSSSNSPRNIMERDGRGN